MPGYHDVIISLTGKRRCGLVFNMMPSVLDCTTQSFIIYICLFKNKVQKQSDGIHYSRKIL